MRLFIFDGRHHFELGIILLDLCMAIRLVDESAGVLHVESAIPDAVIADLLLGLSDSHGELDMVQSAVVLAITRLEPMGNAVDQDFITSAILLDGVLFLIGIPGDSAFVAALRHLGDGVECRRGPGLLLLVILLYLDLHGVRRGCARWYVGKLRHGGTGRGFLVCTLRGRRTCSNLHVFGTAGPLDEFFDTLYSGIRF